MPRGKKFTAEQIIGKLREAEVGLAQGKTVPRWPLACSGVAGQGGNNHAATGLIPFRVRRLCQQHAERDNAIRVG